MGGTGRGHLPHVGEMKPYGARLERHALRRYQSFRGSVRTVGLVMAEVTGAGEAQLGHIF